MARVKSTAKATAPAKKAARKPRQVKPEVDIDAIVAKAVEASTKAALEILAKSKPDPQIAHRVKEAAIEARVVSREEYQKMSDEEKSEYNSAQMKKVEQRKRQAQSNRAGLESMSTSQRIKAMLAPRDPSIIREADNPNGEEMVEVLAMRAIGLNNFETSEVDEKIRLPVSAARRLQDSGAVKVAI